MTLQEQLAQAEADWNRAKADWRDALNTLGPAADWGKINADWREAREEITRIRALIQESKQ